MQRSKLMFSDAELQMACNQEVILTKNRIIEKVYEQFGLLGHNIFEKLTLLRNALPEETGVIPKISKGEQYRGLPWVMLDYPRWFHQTKGHLSLRVMFWWGNYFLVQLHVSGIYRASVIKKSAEWVKNGKISGSGWWMGFPVDPWNFLLPQPGIFDINSLEWRDEFTKSGIFKIIKTESLNGLGIYQTTEKLAMLLQEAFLEEDQLPNL